MTPDPDPTPKEPQGSDFADESVFEEEVPTVQSTKSASMQGGWGEAKKLSASVGTGSDYYFKFTADAQLIAFILPEPCDSYKQHWVERKGQRSFRCLGADCPLCAVGSYAGARYSFWVLNFIVDGDEIDPKPQLMEVGIKAFKQLLAIDENKKIGGPLYDNFFQTYRTGKEKDVSYTFTLVKQRDVVDDWKIPIQDALDELADARATSKPKAYEPTKESLMDIAKEIKSGI
jgi:hypothetical protein